MDLISDRLRPLFSKAIDVFVYPQLYDGSQSVLRKHRIAVKFSLAIQVGVMLYILLDTAFVRQPPPGRPFVFLFLGFNLIGLILGRILHFSFLTRVLTPITILGAMVIAAINNGGLFGPIPSCFAISVMVTFAILNVQVAKSFVYINIAIFMLLFWLNKIGAVVPVGTSAVSYFMIDVVELVTIFWFFNMYEGERQRLTMVEQEHHNLQTITQMVATLNHEINTPLNAAMLATELAIAEGSVVRLNEALRAIHKIQDFVKQISSIKPENFLVENYRRTEIIPTEAKIYKVESHE